MPAGRHILSIDQGTTSTRAILFDRDGRPGVTAQVELPQIYPQSGWVEHDAERIRSDSLQVARDVVEQAGVETIEAIGITNQRETTLLWDRETGEPLHNAIVWQDRRTAAHCERIVQEGAADIIAARTGLVVDAYFSASKLAWLLDNVAGARDLAEAGKLAFGTVDSYLLWHLTGGRVHATDASNAARTMLYNIHDNDWDDELLGLFRIPRAVLGTVCDCSGELGVTDSRIFGRAIPITGMAGDQQAASFGQALFEPGMVKSTYGTGCFMLLNTGDRVVTSSNRLLSTIAWRIGGRTTYALEGSIFVAGAAVQWVRDGLRAIGSAHETEALAAGIDDTGGAYLVPAFTGLGAPYWDPDARGALVGLSRATGVAEIARAALESVAYQSRDLMEAMAADMRAEGAAAPNALRVDGGLVANDWAMQFLADILDLPIERPVVTETTALGAAYLAGLATGFYASQATIAEIWQRQRRFEPQMPAARRNALCAGWRRAVAQTRHRG
ncbi:glycerol kinase GlpK [Oceanibacterium hippocampi]|uniref:Glycerol kinase n=1 Tax=Oceanibacterium hippocampi TaxID=745714 RepID=A0A1Y5SX91_9PROT|nr:glycerol kinase GlpK [Oceanibacterium hippocampi]SLN48951.1 Glycerol kinase [Oceanibacterium hippocampi]